MGIAQLRPTPTIQSSGDNMGGKVGKAVKKVAKVATFGASELITGGQQKTPDINIPQAQQLTPAGPPTIDEAREAAERGDLLRRRRGRAATILTSQAGDTSTTNVGTKTLLGG